MFTRRTLGFSISSPVQSSTEKLKILQNQGPHENADKPINVEDKTGTLEALYQLSDYAALYKRSHFCILFQLSKMQKELEIPDCTQLNVPVLIFSAMLEDFQGVGIERHISQKHSSHLLQLGLCTPLPDLINPDKIESEITHIKNCSLN